VLDELIPRPPTVVGLVRLRCIRGVNNSPLYHCGHSGRDRQCKCYCKFLSVLSVLIGQGLYAAAVGCVIKSTLQCKCS